METTETLPRQVEQKVKPWLGPEEDILLSASSDIGADARFGEQWLVITGSRLMVVSGNGHGNGHSPLLEMPVKGITEVKAENLVGNGILEVTANGRPVEVLRYSNTQARKFTRVAKALEEFAKEGKELKVEEDDETFRTRCRNCGRVLPDWSDICPACIHRGKTILRLFGFLKPYWHISLCCLFFSFLTTGIDLVPPYLTKILVDDVLKPQKNPHMLGLLVLAMIGLYLSGMAVSIARGWMMTWLGGKITLDVRDRLYQSMQRLSLSFYDKRQTGGLMSRITRDSDYLFYLISDGAQYFVINILQILGIGFILFKMNWQLALLILVPAPLLITGTVLFWRRIRGMYHRLWNRWSSMSALLSDALSGIRVVKAFAQEDREIQRFGQKNYNLFQAGVKAERTWAVFWPFMGLSTAMGGWLIWYSGGNRVLEDTMTLGTLMAFMNYMWMFYGPLQAIAHENNWMQRALTAAERIFEILDSEPESYDAPDAVPMPDIKGRVEFKNVSFGYDKHKPVLKDINLEVAEGEMIGLVGQSGAGKSTTINLICRFYDVQEGQILIDGVDIRRIRLSDIRKQIGVVPQETYLFHGTIADNIAYGKRDAIKADIIRAARAANIHDAIMRFPDGYDTQVGERGMLLSGGERQRISIARAILHNPKVLILDEATSSVDTETEKQIQEALGRLIRQRTTFAIAHRLSTLRNATRLMVLEKGKVVEMGTHEELVVKEGGVYKKLVDIQTELSQIKGVEG
ncbi:MAG: ABC transporter ATP-binding protein [Armatimonadetes bacterium]|nr:ABC transporter ATP-binding protein [Armatimonadota bacterium]